MRKNNILLAGVLALGALVCSCDSREKLSEELQGIWAGNPEQLADTGAARATMTRLMEFTKTGEPGSGNVTLTAYITVEYMMAQSDSVVAPLTITASGVASITGVYQAKDDDDVILNLDASSMSVQIDPDAVQLNYNALTGGSSSVPVNLQSGAQVLASQQITRAAQKAFFNLSEIEDIEFHNDYMTCEFGKTKLTFTRQSGNQ